MNNEDHVKLETPGRTAGRLSTTSVTVCVFLITNSVYANGFTTEDRARVHTWKASVATMAAAHTTDIMSSIHAYEANPLLRGHDGRLATKRAVALKSAAVSGSVVSQWLMIKNRRTRALSLRVFPVLNLGQSGMVFGVAVRNFKIKEKK